jgi:hypothetical protein
MTEILIGRNDSQALASTLRDGGVPSPVERVLVSTPTAHIGAITDAERSAVRQRSPVSGQYDAAINLESAAEILAQRANEKAADLPNTAKKSPVGGVFGGKR